MPDPPCAVLSGTALPLPLSGGTMSYSSSTSLVLGVNTQTQTHTQIHTYTQIPAYVQLPTLFQPCVLL